MSTYQAGGIPISGSLSGTETVVVGNGGPQITTATTRQIADLAGLTSDNFAITALNTVGAATITAAGIAGGVTSRGGAQSATPFTDTTPTAAMIIAQLPAGAPVGTSFYWTYDNTTDAAATLSAALGVTLSGNSIIPGGQFTQYLVTKTAAATVTIASVFSGLLSPLPVAQYSVDTAQGTTLQVAGLVGAQINNLALTGTTPATVQVGTAASLILAIPNARVGMTSMLNVRNAAATTTTLLGLTGVTISGTATINPSVTRMFMMSVPTASTITLQNIGAMTG